ncbi:hypothetical protein SSX86_030252 [Deinandra increscens subsp. villosa]|uniref:Uncharacterized protein n=1 Tax=Deinandra increscens subsp. villosa TaxID=3103831 RepID=A0AAP0GIR9_9ASTR
MYHLMKRMEKLMANQKMTWQWELIENVQVDRLPQYKVEKKLGKGRVDLVREEEHVASALQTEPEWNFSEMKTLLSKISVKDALGVGDIYFVSCSPVVYQAMIMNWMINFEAGIPHLLEDGIKLLVYAGAYDLICNCQLARLVFIDPGSNHSRC